MTHAHAVVWLDQSEAKIIQFNAEGNEEAHIAHHVHHPHHESRKDPGKVHAGRDDAYFHDIAKALLGVRELLVLGPGLAKQEFVKHLEAHDPSVAKAVLGVEASDHPSEGQILDHARKFFKAKDRMIAH